MKRCPKCGNETFNVSAHVVQDWLVDSNGNFIKCLNDCVEVTHSPKDDDIWQCSKCGYDGSGKEFNFSLPLDRIPALRSLYYELYKLYWENTHLTKELQQASWQDYVDALKDGVDCTYAEYVDEYGYCGELYACFEEFLDSEYRDVEFIHTLIDYEPFYELYLADIGGENHD